MDPAQNPLTPSGQEQIPSPTVQPTSKPNKFNVLAIISFILAFIFPLISLVLSLISLGQIKRTGEKGKGLAITSLVLSILFTLLSILLVVLLIPSYRSTLNQTSGAIPVATSYVEALKQSNYSKAYDLRAKELLTNGGSFSEFQANSARLHLDESCTFTGLTIKNGRWNKSNTRLDGANVYTVSGKLNCDNSSYTRLRISVIQDGDELKVANLTPQ